MWARLHRVPHPVRLFLIRNASYLLRRRPPEPHIAALLQAVLDVCDIRRFWDVGAHIGYYSWLACATRPQLSVLAIEPDAVNVGLIQRTRIYAPAVMPLNVAVSGRDGSADFLVDSIAGTTGTLQLSSPSFNERNYGERPARVTVATRTVDSLAAEHGAPELLKIDVEDHENAVIEGAAALLQSRPIIFIESFDPGSDAVRRLQAHEYRVLAGESLAEEPARDGNYVALPPDVLPRLSALRDAYARRMT
jgi:FkbM family methyltransferase